MSDPLPISRGEASGGDATGGGTRLSASERRDLAIAIVVLTFFVWLGTRLIFPEWQPWRGWIDTASTVVGWTGETDERDRASRAAERPESRPQATASERTEAPYTPPVRMQRNAQPEGTAVTGGSTASTPSDTPRTPITVAGPNPELAVPDRAEPKPEPESTETPTPNPSLTPELDKKPAVETGFVERVPPDATTLPRVSPAQSAVRDDPTRAVGARDRDGDGTPDANDDCPDASGPSANLGCPAVDLPAADRAVLAQALDSVAFNTGSARLTDASHVVLADVADLMSRYPDYRLRISGHTDASGDAEANRLLSEARALACGVTLQRLGVAPDRLRIRGVGAAEPVADNDTDAGRRRNRRVEFTLF